MAIFNDNYNRGALEFFQFVLSGYLALGQRAAPGGYDFLFFAAIFLSLWFKKKWFDDKYNECAFLNLTMGLSLYMAIQREVNDTANMGFDAIMRWTMFALFALQWIIFHV